MPDAVHNTFIPSIQAVSLETNRFLELRRRLIELHPEIDEQTLADTLEGVTDLHEALASIIRSALEDEATAGGLKVLMDNMRYRLDRLESRATAKRQVVLESMEATEIRKLQAPDFTASLRNAPQSLVIVHEEGVPSEFLIEQPPKIDRRGLLRSVVAGATYPGIALAQPRNTLSVRTL